MEFENKQNDLAFVDEVVSEHKKRWKRGTNKLKVGVSFATVLLMLYSVLLFLPINKGLDEVIATRTLLLYILYGIVALALAFLCAQNYLRGLSRFATLFEGGGKRSLFLVRWGFIISAAGVVLQMMVFFGLNMGASSITFGNLILGNALLLAGAVVGIVGFLSLATAKGMTDDGRKGALHMSWSTLVIFAGAVLLSYALYKGWALKVVCTLVNLTGACLFYKQWKRIIAWPETDAKQEMPAPAENQEDVPTEREETKE